MLQMLELPEVNVCDVLYRDFSVCLLLSVSFIVDSTLYVLTITTTISLRQYITIGSHVSVQLTKLMVRAM